MQFSLPAVNMTVKYHGFGGAVSKKIFLKVTWFSGWAYWAKDVIIPHYSTQRLLVIRHVVLQST